MEIFLFFTLLFVVAFLYAAVGHGGASGYLALMAVFGTAPVLMKSSALLLNLMVSLIAYWQFSRKHPIKWSFFLPLILASIPLAFWGGSFSINAIWYKKILAILLVIPIIRFGILQQLTVKKIQEPPIYALVLAGGSIGFLSGLIGIGGGILLSPLCMLMGWSAFKQTATISALFIFVNSLAGLAGMYQNGLSITPQILTWVLVALAGGLAGAYSGSLKLPVVWLNRILAAVLLIAVIKLVFV
ncbi:MAG: sulfite exporter TauE/SafE family protein [Chitinophagaceae bacterium]